MLKNVIETRPLETRTASGIFVLLFSFFFLLVSPAGADVPNPNAPHCIQQTPPAPVTITTSSQRYALDSATMNQFCIEQGYARWIDYTLTSSCEIWGLKWNGSSWEGYFGGHCPDSVNPGYISTSITCAANTPTVAGGCPLDPAPVEFPVYPPGDRIDSASLTQECVEHGYSRYLNYSQTSACEHWPWYWDGSSWHRYFGGHCPDSNNPGNMAITVICAL